MTPATPAATGLTCKTSQPTSRPVGLRHLSSAQLSLLAAVQDTQADMVVVLARPRSYFGDLFHHSVTARLQARYAGVGAGTGAGAARRSRRSFGRVTHHRLHNRPIGFRPTWRAESGQLMKILTQTNSPVQPLPARLLLTGATGHMGGAGLRALLWHQSDPALTVAAAIFDRPLLALLPPMSWMK